MEAKKSGFVVLIGRPNTGKSTLMNRLIGQKIAIMSDKPQTTRKRIRTVYTDERGQVVFLDTPGIHKPKNKLGTYMVESALRTVNDADIIIWIVEASEYIGERDIQISQLLKAAKKPVILAVNKIDLLNKNSGNKNNSAETAGEKLIRIIDKYNGLFEFAEIVPLSALKSDNVEKLMELIFKYLPVGPMYYDEDTVTDQSVRQIAAEIIREKVLKVLSYEVPHGTAVDIILMKDRKSKDLIDIDAEIVCEKESHKLIIIGKGGRIIKKIGMLARADIEDMCEKQVNLKLRVKVRKNWRDSDIQLKSFGYDVFE